MSSLPAVLTNPKKEPAETSQHDAQTIPSQAQTNLLFTHVVHTNPTENHFIFKSTNHSEPLLSSVGVTLKKPSIGPAITRPLPVAPKVCGFNSYPAHGIYTGSNKHMKCYTSGSLTQSECADTLKDTERKPVPTDVMRAEQLDTTLANQNPYLSLPFPLDFPGLHCTPYYNSAMQFSALDLCHDLIPQSPLGYDILRAPYTKVDGVFSPSAASDLYHSGNEKKGGSLSGSRVKTSLHYINPFNRKNLNFVATKVLHEWFAAHIEYPYPTNEEVHLLARAGNVTEVQVRKWLANRRLRTGNTFKYAYSRKRHQFGALKMSGHHYLPSAMSSASFTGNEENQPWISPEAFRREHDEDDGLKVRPNL